MRPGIVSANGGFPPQLITRARGKTTGPRFDTLIVRGQPATEAG